MTHLLCPQPFHTMLQPAQTWHPAPNPEEGLRASGQGSQRPGDESHLLSRAMCFLTSPPRWGPPCRNNSTREVSVSRCSIPAASCHDTGKDEEGCPVLPLSWQIIQIVRRGCVGRAGLSVMPCKPQPQGGSGLFLCCFHSPLASSLLIAPVPAT